jgi:hypothetical protein
MEDQIILLPKEGYWNWVRASTDYVLTYGPNLTPEAVVAANYLTPRQVITFPCVKDAWPESADIASWFRTQRPGVRLDPIDASTPDGLQSEFEQRIDTKDRYGQKRRPFYLLWPTDYPLITQRFGANPQIYSRFGVPAHEGLDIRAPMNSEVRCCFDGQVYEVHLNPNDHPYGIHVRVLHRDGYRTIYAHLARPLVSMGEHVAGGQPIGKADSTGASTGAHLHLTLERDGATARGETTWPKDILDPTPFMVWPEARAAAAPAAKGWTSERCLIGVHGRVGGNLEEADLQTIATGRIEAVKIGLSERRETIEKLRALRPGVFLVARVTTDLSSKPVTAQQFLSSVEPDVGRLFRLGVRDFEVLANPNLQSEGWGRSWRNGWEFAGWFREVTEGLRTRYSEAHFGFPGLSPGETIQGIRDDDQHFLMEAEGATPSADWIGVNCYWTSSSGLMAWDGGRRFAAFRDLFPDRVLMLTEFGNPLADVPPEVKAQQYVDYFRMLRSVRGLDAAFCYALSSPSGSESVVWRREGGESTGIAEAVGHRDC